MNFITVHPEVADVGVRVECAEAQLDICATRLNRIINDT